MEKNNQFRTSIGGQALIEGILMRGPEKQAIVVRSPEGLVTRVEELTRPQRVQELARIMVGENITDSALKSAEEMLES